MKSQPWTHVKVNDKQSQAGADMLKKAVEQAVAAKAMTVVTAPAVPTRS